MAMQCTYHQQTETDIQTDGRTDNVRRQ